MTPKPRAPGGRAGAYATKDEVLCCLHEDLLAAGSQKALAKALRCSPQYLNDILNGRREPVRDVLNRLGFRKVVLYERLV